MASVISRNDKFCVVYSYCDKDGKRRQKWETFKTLGEADTRKIEIEYSQQVGNFVIPNCTTVSELMKEYVSIYGKNKAVAVRILQQYRADQSLHRAVSREIETRRSHVPYAGAILSEAPDYAGCSNDLCEEVFQ